MKATAITIESAGEKLTIDIPIDMIGHKIEIILIDKISENDKNIKLNERETIDWNSFIPEETESFNNSLSNDKDKKVDLKLTKKILFKYSKEDNENWEDVFNVK